MNGLSWLQYHLCTLSNFHNFSCRHSHCKSDTINGKNTILDLTKLDLNLSSTSYCTVIDPKSLNLFQLLVP